VRRGSSNRRTLSVALALLALAGLPRLARGQGADFFEQKQSYFRDETIEGVSKHAESLTETPATVTVISREDIERYGFRTAADVLNFASLGAFAHNDRRYDFAGGRGLFFFEDFNTRVLVMLDGHPLNEPWNNFGGLGREMLLPLDLVERIEIVYGPSALLYGGYSLYGIVNVITQTGETAAGRRVRVSGGSWRTGEAVASWGASGVKAARSGGPGTSWNVLAAGGYYSSEGEPLDLPVQEVGYAATADGQTRWGGPQTGTDYERAPFGFLFAQKGEVTVLARAGLRRHGAPLAPYESLYGSRREYVRDAKSFVETRWDHAFSKSLSLSTRAFYDGYSYEEHDPYADAETGDADRGYDFVLRTDDSDAGGEVRLSFQKGGHYVLAGGEYRRRRMTQRSFNDLFPGGLDAASLLEARVGGHLAVGYFQERWQAADWLALVVGGNYADTQPGGSKAQPRVAVIAKPRSNLSIKGIYARGFRPPSIFEAAYHDYVNQVDNPSLRSEEITSYELSTMWNAGPRLSLQAYGFHSRLRGLIRGVTLEAPEDAQGGVMPPSGDPADLVGQLQYQSTGDVRARGAGLAVRTRLRAVSAYANVAYARGRLLGAGDEESLPASSSWLASGGLSAQAGLWTASLSARYVGPQPLDASRGTGRAGDFVELNARVVRRLRLVYPITLSLDVRNLLDTRGGLAASPVYTPATVPVEGRRALFGADVRF